MSGDDPTTDMLVTLGEAGGITGLVAIVFMLIVRTIKKRGCTCKLYGCAGQPVAEIDCHQDKRYVPRDASSSEAPRVDVTVEPPEPARPASASMLSRMVGHII